MSEPEKALETMIANMAAKTGKSLPEWLKLVAASGLARHRDIMTMLKTSHAMTHGFANMVALKALETGASPADLVAEQYSGRKANLRPIYDAIAAFVRTLGPDVEIAPKKGSVSVRRKKQFALIQPASQTRVDLGVNLKGNAADGRLELWGGMISHRVRLVSAKDFDTEVKSWLKRAYSAAQASVTTAW